MSPAAPTRSARRRLTTALAAVLACTAAGPRLALAAKQKVRVEVWKDPNCGCCKDWIAGLAREGFAVVSHDTGNASARRRLGMPSKYGSCHTATVDGYVIEGHVPVEDIRRLLSQRPDAIGLAVPGMPVGSPGMDGAIHGGRKDPYDVLLVRRDGSAEVARAVR